MKERQLIVVDEQLVQRHPLEGLHINLNIVRLIDFWFSSRKSFKNELSRVGCDQLQARLGFEVDHVHRSIEVDFRRQVALSDDGEDEGRTGHLKMFDSNKKCRRKQLLEFSTRLFGQVESVNSNLWLVLSAGCSAWLGRSSVELERVLVEISEKVTIFLLITDK